MWGVTIWVIGGACEMCVFGSGWEESFCFNIPQDPSRVLCGRDARKFKRKFDLNTANDGASAKASTFHALN